MNTALIVLGVIAAIVIIAILVMIPELRRYFRIRKM
jgi:hypothetical protein